VILSNQNVANHNLTKKTSSDKYVSPHREHISQKGKDFVIFENANLKFANFFQEAFQQTKSAYLLSLWCLWTHQATLSSNPTSAASDQETRAKDR
jgi:hypothetical protein